MNLKSIVASLLAAAALTTSVHANETELVAKITGVQITGVTVDATGDVFVNAPNWRDGVPFAVAKLTDSGTFSPYPNTEFNECVATSTVRENCFLAVQSVVAHKGKLYVLDTRNPKFKTVKDAPRLFVFDLKTNQLDKVLKLNHEAFHKNSYINDLRVDDKTNRLYMTDSSHAGLVVYNLKNDSSFRLLDDHEYTKAHLNALDIQGKPFNMQVQSDGIALDTVNNTLYFHALSGYELYAVNTADIANKSNNEMAKSVRLVATTGATDGMIFDSGNLYLADLEQQLVQYLTPSNDLRTLVEGKSVNWADTFSIYNNELYYTNSKIQDAGADVSSMTFEVFKVGLPKHF